MEEKKIALLLAQPDEPYQQGLIRGAMKTAFAHGFSVTVFSMYIKYQNSRERELAESNIFNLIPLDEFDAIILFADLIQTPGVVQELEKRLHQEFPGPVVVVDRDSEFFFSFWTDGYDAVYAEVSHMIEEHGLKDIAYLTGRRQHVHSKQRLRAFRDAMADHGLEVAENRVFFGDFWYNSGTNCAEELLRNRGDLPEAIICANDCMAIGVAEELQKHGVRIPEDIRLAGYGTTEEGQTSPQTLTSTYIPAEYYGSYSVDAVLQLLQGKEVAPPHTEDDLYIGESCGCHPDGAHLSKRRQIWMTGDSEEGFESVHNFLAEDLLCASSPDEFFRTLYESIYYLRGVRSLDICLDICWLNPEEILKDSFLREGYPAWMVNTLSYDAEDPSRCRVGMDRVFDTEQLFPVEEQKGGRGVIVMPLFFEGRSFGYAILGYDPNKAMYETVTRLWLNTVMRGLESLRRNCVIRQMERDRAAKYPLRGSGTEMSAISGVIAGLSGIEQMEMQEVERILNENLFTYHFQPIVSAVDGEIFSYEALMRSGTERKIPPLSILRYADLLDRIRDVEKATFFNVLDIVKKRKDIFETRKIFINSIPGCKLDYVDYAKIENLLSENSGRTVVELTEQAELSDDELESLKQQYRRLGIGMAVDDYGTGYSNVSNLLRYMPDYVKIDRSLLSGIQDSAQKQHFVREIVDFCHANQIQALAEGVETREELATVIRLGADFIQGYYIGRPAEEIVESIDSNVKMEISRFHQEKEDGTNDQTYIAGSTSRVSLTHLVKENKSTIVIGAKDATFRDITISGTPNSDTKIHIEVLEGYDGRVTLENVCLSNRKKRPCIIMAEGSKMTLVIEGENCLKGGGIKVPRNSKLTVEGDGNLKILLTGADCYAIGNSEDSGHGVLDFYQDGEISIESNGKTTIGIGSGLGGDIHICKGKYVIRLTGDEGVGIGSLKGDQPVEIHDCDLFLGNSFYKGVYIGNLAGESRVRIWRSLVRCTGSGKTIATIGTVDGASAEVEVNDLAIQIDLRSDYLTGIGSLTGKTRLRMSYAGFTYKGIGRQAMVYGGFNENTELDINNTDLAIDLTSDSGKLTNAPSENVKEEYCRSRIIVNGEDRGNTDS